jgi:hypothetical protein
VRDYAATVEIDSNAHTFYCPVCGTDFELPQELPDINVFYDEPARCFIKWAPPGAAAQAEVVEKVDLGPGSRLRLLVRAKPRDFRQLFYSAALVFVIDGEISQNQLFAPPENCKRYGLQITNWVPDAGDRSIELHFTLKGGFRGRVTLPAVFTRAATNPQTGRVDNGSALTVWPNFKRRGWQEKRQRDDGGHDLGAPDATDEHGPWRDYFVQFATADAAVKPKSLRLVGEAPGQEQTLAGPGPKGALDFPPDYIEVTADVARPGEAARPFQTCFSVKLDSYPPQTGAALSKLLRVAVDFGTSNTCVCYIVPGDAERGDAGDDRLEPKLLRLTNKTYEVVRGLQLSADPSNTWLPDLEGQDFIPSELVFRDDPQRVLAEAKPPRPVLDYTIPAARWRTGEEERICTGFKWKHATEPPAVREQYRELQQMYLDLLLRMVVAELAASGGPLAGTEVHPNKIELVYTYPLAMPKERWQALGRVLETVGQALHERTGVAVTVKAGVDESRAGEAAIKMQAEGQRIFMDIGGGTTDIAVIEQRAGAAKRELLLVDSLRYAGNDFLAALSNDARGGHISTRLLIELQRRVRFFKRAALEDISVFGGSEERKEDAQAALERFLLGMMQYLARLIVLQLNTTGAEGRPKKLHVFLLGNGWNFVLFLPRDPLASRSATPKEVMQEEISKRLIEELEKFRKGEFIKFELKFAENSKGEEWKQFFELHFPEEPKRAVASGALEVTRRPAEGVERTFVGSDIEVVTAQGVQAFRWDKPLPLDLGAVIERVSISNPVVLFEDFRVPDYQYEHAPIANLRDIDIKRYVSNDRGQLVASAFNVYLERWYKNFLTGAWATNHRGGR